MTLGRFKKPILPFPDTIDRDYFGAWLSGFVDGEGCFYLGWRKARGKACPSAVLQIGLRFDDHAILENIRSFWRCGRIYYSRNNGPSQKDRNGRPSYVYLVTVTSSLIEVVIPHFMKFPLLAKKARDFEIWKQAVEYMHSVYPGKSRCVKGKPRGTIYWTAERLEHYQYLMTLQRSQRDPDNAVPPRPPEPSTDGWLPFI